MRSNPIFSHSIIRAVAPTGHLHTVEFHEERSKIARAEFADHSLSDSVTVYHRDVIEFGFPESVDHTADAVFLDIPAPYKCIGHVKRALKLNGGYFCNFSPCIEQTQKTCEELRKEGFNEIRTIELINNAKNVKTYSMPLPEFGVELEELVKADILPDLSKTDSGYLSTVRWPTARWYNFQRLYQNDLFTKWPTVYKPLCEPIGQVWSRDVFQNCTNVLLIKRK